MRRFGANIVFAGLLFGATANGNPEGRTAEARVLFAEGRERMAAGDWEAAQAKLEASQRMFPGKGILYNLAVCYEHTGHLASAWTRYLEVAAAERREGDEERAGIATADATRIEARVPRLTINVVRDTPDLRIEYDGTLLETAARGTPLPLNSGTHVVQATAPGRIARIFPVDLHESERATVDVDTLEIETPPVLVLAPPPARKHSSWLRPAAVVSGSLGLGGLVSGTIFAIASAVVYSDANAYCNPNGVCSSSQGVELRARSLGFGDVSTVSFAVGGALVLASVALWVFAPNASSKKTAVLRF